MPKQFEDINAYMVIDKLLKQLIPETKKIAIEIKNNPSFGNKSEHLDIASLTTELVNECNKLKNLNSSSLSVNRDEKENEMSYSNAKTFIEDYTQPIKTIRHLLMDVQVKLNKKFEAVHANLSPQDLFHFETQLDTIDKLQIQYATINNYFELLTALVGYGYDPKIDYAFNELTAGAIQDTLEIKDHARMNINERRISEMQSSAREALGGSANSVRVKVSEPQSIPRKQITEIVRNGKLFCGPESPHQILPSFSDYLRNMHKLFRRRIEDLRQKRYIIPDCIPALKRYTLNKIHRELEEKNSGFVMDASGDKIVPKEFITYEFNDIWNEAMSGKYASRLAIQKQTELIEENINFEVVKLRAQSNTLKNATMEEQMKIIIRRFNHDELELYEALLPQTRKLGDIIRDSIIGLAH